MTATADPPQARPAPGPASAEILPGTGTGTGAARAELVESDTGWTLTLHLDAAAARAIRTQLSGQVLTDIELGSVTASVLPNLVPGEPFAVNRFAVVVAEDSGGAPEPADGRPLPG